jgi:hypothetical protein
VFSKKVAFSFISKIRNKDTCPDFQIISPEIPLSLVRPACPVVE